MAFVWPSLRTVPDHRTQGPDENLHEPNADAIITSPARERAGSYSPFRL